MYAPSLYGIALSILKNEEDASDVLQESLLKIWKNIDKYNPKKGSFFTWMLNITRNTAIDKYRKKQKEQEIVTTNVESIKAFFSIQNSIDAIGLKEIISQLSREEIEVIDELYFKGATHKEAAETLNLPLGTVKTRIRGALIKLREIYRVRK